MSGCSSKFTPRSDYAILRETAEQRKGFGKISRRKPPLSKENKAAQLRFAKLYLKKPQDLWNNVLGQTRSKWHNIQPSYLITTVKHGSGRMMIRARFAATGPGHPAVNRELLCIPKYFRVKCEAICVTA